MNQRIEELKKQVNDEKNKGGDWKTPYQELIKLVYNEPVLFFALAKSDFNKERKTSTPLISTKDFNGAPALYVFTDVSYASEWMSHYRHVTPDMQYGLIGAVRKDYNDFLQIFKIAKRFGARFMMLDEGGTYVGITLNDFIRGNDMDINNIQICLTKEQAEDMMANKEAPTIKFSEIPAIPLAK